MPEVSLFSAFLAGFLTFLAPCTLPLIPAYLAFLAGTETPKDHIVFKRALGFVSGFGMVIVLLGIFVSQMGRFVAAYRNVFIMVGGVLFLLFGLTLLGIIKIPIQSKGLPAKVHPQSTFASFLLGIAFAFGWSPCVGPILGSIYILVAQSGSLVFGTFLLVLFALGHAIPFLLLAFFYEKSFHIVETLNKYTERINKAAGIFLLVIGVFMVLGKYGYVIDFLSRFLDGAWQQRLLDYL